MAPQPGGSAAQRRHLPRAPLSDLVDASILQDRHVVADAGADYLDRPAFLRRSGAPAPRVSRPSPAALPPHHLPRALLHALYLALLGQLGHRELDLAQAMAGLPHEDLAELCTWLRWRGLSNARPADAATLLLALLSILDAPALDDAQELALALLLRGASTDAASTLTTWLIQAISDPADQRT